MFKVGNLLTTNPNWTKEIYMTPISAAYNNYCSMRSRGGYRNLSPLQRGWYFSYRSNRSYTKRWKSSGKDNLIQEGEESLEAAKATLADWKEFIDWFSGHSFDDAKNSNSKKRSQNMLVSKMQADFDEVEERIEVFTDGDTILTNIKDDIIETVVELGLVPSSKYEEEDDDGCLWLKQEDSDVHFFIALGNLHGRYYPFNILDGFTTAYAMHNWNNYPYLDLMRGVLRKSSHSHRHVGMRLNDYFGLYNSLEISESDASENVVKALDALPLISRRS